MKLFLASALAEMKEQLLQRLGPLVDKKIAYITNPADETIAKRGVDLERIKSDRDMLLGCGAELFPIDIRIIQSGQLKEVFETCEMIYVSGGDTYYFRQLARESEYDTLIESFVQEKRMPYISSSAGSCIMGTSVKYLEGRLGAFSLFNGFGFVDAIILPHWGSVKFQEHYTHILPMLYMEGRTLVTITDNQAIWMEDRKIEIIERIT